MKYSVAVKLNGHEADVVRGYPVARYLVANNEPIGRWLRGILEGNDNNWLLGMILRHPDINQRRSNVCVVRCGKCNHLVVTLDDADVPSPGTLVPTISIDTFLAMNHGGDFVDDKIHDFGVLKDGSLFDHIRSGIDSGFNLVDLRVYVYPNIHAVRETYTDAPEGGRLVRFCFQPESWNLAREVMIDDLQTCMSMNTDNKANETSTAVVQKIPAPVKARGNEKKRRDNNNKNTTTELSKGENSVKLLEATTPSTTTKSSIAESSCFYVPFCNKLARECGGIRKGLCNEVNSGAITIPSDEVFFEEKRKLKKQRKQERKVMSKNLIVAELSEKAAVEINESKGKGMNSTETSTLFNPREYILLFRAWNDELTASDMKDAGKKYTKQDCKDASAILNNIAEALHKEKSDR